MKLLRVVASNFKNCENNFTIDFIAKSRKTSEDKMYELHEIDNELFVYNTMAFIGKNASGKTSAIELLDCCYSILGTFHLENKHYSVDNVYLEMYFYQNGIIYKYTCYLKEDISNLQKVAFENQHLYKKKYYKSRLSSIFDSGFSEISKFTDLPEDTSIVFFILKKSNTNAIYFDCNGLGENTYRTLFNVIKSYNIRTEIISNILTIFDDNIKELSVVDEHSYKLIYRNETKVLSGKELLWFLSSGTTKGVLLYTMMVLSLKYGFSLLVDEIENHFHKSLVENMISLYKDRTVNKNQATLIFTTHYCELLDLFGRQDNIWISKSDDKISLSNMYADYDVRSELLKSRQFYNNAFDTAVNYNALMDLKRYLSE